MVKSKSIKQSIIRVQTNKPNLLNFNFNKMNTAAQFYKERSCNDDYVPVAKFYNERSCNDDYVPVTRSTCEPNRLEKKYYENNTIIRQYTDANIRFREITKGFPLMPEVRLETDPCLETVACLEADPRLEAVDAKLEANELEFEKILNGSEDDIIRPSFDNENIRIEDFGLHYYHYMSISFFNSYDPVNVISKTPMSDDEEIDDPDYFDEHQRLSDKYEKY